jgi:hypothetical protein
MMGGMIGRVVAVVMVMGLAGVGVYWYEHARPAATPATVVVAHRDGAASTKRAMRREPVRRWYARGTTRPTLHRAPATERAGGLVGTARNDAIRELQSEQMDDGGGGDGAGFLLVDEEMAWAALQGVGMDDLADGVWLEAVNDPKMSPDARRELILGLVTEGIGDPRSLSDDEKQVVMTRRAMVEQLLDEPMDEVNEQALREAGDGLAMLMGEGPTPVQVVVPAPAPETAAGGNRGRGNVRRRATKGRPRLRQNDDFVNSSWSHHVGR